MDPRIASRRRATTRDRATPVRCSPIPADRRGGFLLGAAAAGALLVSVVVGAEPAVQSDAAVESVSVAAQLGLTSHHTTTDVTDEVAQLEDLAASRSSRDAAESAARQVQAAADRAELKRQRAEVRAKARAAAKAAAEAAAKEAAAAAAAAEAAPDAPAPSGTAVSAIAQITNSAGPVRPQAQAAANAVVSNVPGAAGITIGGTRASAADPGGHPSGLALDYMVMSDAALGDAIVQYHIDNWDALGVDYLIWQQRYLGSPGGGWSYMGDRGSATANHMDHPHVNYRP